MSTNWSSWWSLKAYVAVARQQWSVLHRLILPFMRFFFFFLFFFFVALIPFYPQQKFFQSWSQSSQTLPLFYWLSLCNKYIVVSSTILTVSLPGVNSIAKNNSLCSFIRKRFLFAKVLSLNEWVLVAQSYPTLCDHMDCSLLGSSIQGILQARILE